MSQPTHPSTPHPTSNHGYHPNQEISHSSFSAENLTVSRADVANLVEVGTPVADLVNILLGKGLSQNQVDKIISDLDSYT